MPKPERGDLSAAIRAKGYEWVAATTNLSLLSPTEQKARLGLKVTAAELRATATAVAAASRLAELGAGPAAPAAVDWRNNGGDWTTAIRDQQSCGSCVSFGTCATLEARIKFVSQLIKNLRNKKKAA